VVGNQMKADLQSLRLPIVKVITNGYDPADLDLSQPVEKDEKFTILHIGMLGKARSHTIFWEGLRKLREENPGLKSDLEVRIYGLTDPFVIAQTAHFEDRSWIKFLPYIPHEEVIRVQRAAAVLLLSINHVPMAKGIITGKIFEYLAIGNPILCIGPLDGDAAEILKEAEAPGAIIDFDDPDGFCSAILKMYDNWKNGIVQEQKSSALKYSRKELCGRVAGILDEISTNKSGN
jgi:glycosyltransferase involved in cell wall biosynthesis